VSFEQLIAMVVESDMRMLLNGGDPDQDSSWP
jgi:GDPmannose 4,6-dehydratase